MLPIILWSDWRTLWTLSSLSGSLFTFIPLDNFCWLQTSFSHFRSNVWSVPGRRESAAKPLVPSFPFGRNIATAGRCPEGCSSVCWRSSQHCLQPPPQRLQTARIKAGKCDCRFATWLSPSARLTLPPHLHTSCTSLHLTPSPLRVLIQWISSGRHQSGKKLWESPHHMLVEVDVMIQGSRAPSYKAIKCHTPWEKLSYWLGRKQGRGEPTQYWTKEYQKEDGETQTPKIKGDKVEDLHSRLINRNAYKWKP